jgi:hypothetical protein
MRIYHVLKREERIVDVKGLIAVLQTMPQDAVVTVSSDPIDAKPARGDSGGGEIAGFTKEELKDDQLDVFLYGQELVLIQLTESMGNLIS